MNETLSYILGLVPAATAVASCIGSIAYCIHYTKKAFKKSEQRVINATHAKTNSELIQENSELRQENARLRSDNRLLMKKMTGITFKDGKEQ